MLIIVANQRDSAAQSLVARWAAHDVALLTAADLSVVGWRYYSDPTVASTAVIAGRMIAIQEIVGVLTLWPCVYEQELTHIVPDDRAYVAAEMTAFLISWLTQLTCPVLNRPTATSLLGPSWRPEQWVYLAAQLGIPVRTVRRHVVRGVDRAPTPQYLHSGTVTVVGDRCFGAVDRALAAQARRLAAAAKVDLLAVHFSSPEYGAPLLGADLLPDLTENELADAVLAYLLRGSSSL